MRMFRDFHETEKIVRSLILTFLVMISKKEGQKTLRTLGQST